MDEDDVKKASGCGLLVLYNSIFRRGGNPGSETPSRHLSSVSQSPKMTPSDSLKRRRAASDEESLLVPGNASHPPVPAQAPPPLTNPAKTVVPPKTTSASGYVKASGRPAGGNMGRGRNTGLSSELDSMIHDHQRSHASSNLVRASSGNVMVFGNLGNIRAPGAVTPNRNNVLDYLPMTAKERGEANPIDGSRQRPTGFKNTNAAAYAPNTFVLPENNVEEVATPTPTPTPTPEVLCRALSKRLEPEELKEMGNEEYKKGRYAEAVALYDRAILIDPDKASYWSNKAAALMAMGQLLEAVCEGKEAVRIDPSYVRAHRRLATLYLRLGDAEKAMHHYKLARHEASSEDIALVHRLQAHLSKCAEARKLRDWHSVLKEAQVAVSFGVDAAPQVLAAHVEALLALGRQEEAETTLDSAPKFDIDASTKFFGAPKTAHLLSVRAQILMAAGRFEDAIALAQRAAQIDPSNREVSVVARKTRAVASARSTGNDLFKASKFKEACVAYGNGLDHDPQNAILLCNRAACRSKLGQFEKAIEDCNSALIMRPSYTKARLRRADCNAKLERWEASVQDYEALSHQLPGDEEVGKALIEAQQQLRKQRGEDKFEAQQQLRKQKGEEGTKGAKADANFVHITNKDQLKQYITAPGVCVVLVFSKFSELPTEAIPFMERMSKQYTSVNFLLDLGENSTNGSSAPMFKIYKNGSMVEDVDGFDLEQLESTLRTFLN